ncbi:YALI0F06622p [Yarrowia lipolytica CLIB122]|jgi:hypothetical protein|uniref:YALI0F06622p n=2 Tax=Yarrowia lipolytica TaxID=4952 RepID=Q6C2M4_YARLI|nr:YALI0F06622p [Yarrowia lipolytica CLIB122]KAJ8056026.1 serine-threonine protein kinase 19-domain-containing protein [Yarrowia lipolytica]QNQ01306.1 Hypothetical protein YALI2_F00851g [Yarrowia lipolytica]CAG77895.1 YALI0F06622p [Yarrowia lipolytica CLIB122]SEI32429.1 YALIA101S02e17348g1_1 [Yarrowia lipolytica]VBB83237.1 Conserved hypothetical protein [Yarrowia lipolytica]|eukprot:XP_505088.1 YALI0F06622p [Yarrowia lipolytica CLIB122]
MKFTASTSYRVGKRRAKEPPLMPGQAAFINQLEKQKADYLKANQQEKLPVTSLKSDLKWKNQEKQDSLGDDIVQVVREILDNMYEEIPIGKAYTAPTYEARQNVPPLVKMTHVHAYSLREPTLVLRRVNDAVEAGLLRKVAVNNVDEGVLLMEADKFYKLLDQSIQECKVANQKKALEEFKILLLSHPSRVEFGFDELPNASTLVKSGFLTMNPQEAQMYNVCVPNVGVFLKLGASARTWFINMLKKQSYQEMLEEQMEKKWSANSNRWKGFKGVSFEWILKDLYGGYHCECFSTPVGRGWKLTGK